MLQKDATSLILFCAISTVLRLYFEGELIQVHPDENLVYLCN